MKFMDDDTQQNPSPDGVEQEGEGGTEDGEAETSEAETPESEE